MHRRSLVVCIPFALALAIICGSGYAATFYVDPVNGSAAGDGSDANPWLTIEQVFADGLIESWESGSVLKNPGAPVTGGDTILLRSGYHGEIDAEYYFNRDRITIAADEGHTPQLRRVRMSACSKWTFRGLTISASFGPTYQTLTLVDFNSRFGIGISRENYVEDCFIYTSLDTTGWSAADWVNACSGINLGYEGKNQAARNNVVMNVRHGIVAGCEGAVVEYNEVVNFSADGMRVYNHDVVVQHNVIKNCYNVDDNHDDGIQSYRTGTPFVSIDDVVLRGNLIINQEDPNQPYPGTLQGIGCFDGPYKNWLVENNVILTNHWHGITLFLPENCTVVNNTVFSKWWYNGGYDYRTWIQLLGASGAGNVVRNNIAHTFDLSGCDASNNLTVDRSHDADAWFVDYENFDVRLASGSPAINAGTSTDAPGLDFDGFYRPMGLLWDAGAHEFGSFPPVVADAGDDQTLIDANGDGIELAFLDGSGSFALSGTINSYNWFKNGAYLASGPNAVAVLPVGTYAITLKVSSTTGESASDEIICTVETASVSTPGDADGDGDVDLDDFVILKINFGSTGVGWAQGDFDDDGDVDLDDFVILKNNFGS